MRVAARMAPFLEPEQTRTIMPKLRPLVCLGVLLLTACQHGRQHPNTRPDTLRKQASEQAGVIEVRPLQDPAIRELYTQARAFEAQGKYRWAVKRIRQALRLAPDHPELLQYLAELLLNEGHAELARNYARNSWEKGPRVGPLCSRNWLTMASAYRLERQESKAREAEQQARRCAVQPGKRL